MRSRALQLLLGIGISLVLIALLVRVVDFGAVVTAIGVADVRLIPLAVVAYLVAMVVRSVVWRRLLPVAVPTLALTKIILVGFAVSYVMPLRVGEIARAFLLRKGFGIAYGIILASLVAERVLDGVAVTGILLVALVFQPAGQVTLVLAGVLGAVFTFALGILLLGATQPRLAGRVIHTATRFVPVHRAKVERLAQNFVGALEPLRNWRKTSTLLLLVTAGWLIQFTVFYVLMLAFHVSGAFPMAMLSGSVANFATLLPSAPGFVGTFDAALIRLFVDIQNTDLNTAAAYALVVHAVLVIPVVVLGALILWRADLSLSQVLGRPRRAPTDVDSVPGGAWGPATRAVTRTVVVP